MTQSKQIEGRPLSPSVLAGAKQDVIYHHTGRVRAARTARKGDHMTHEKKLLHPLLHRLLQSGMRKFTAFVFGLVFVEALLFTALFTGFFASDMALFVDLQKWTLSALTGMLLVGNGVERVSDAWQSKPSTLGPPPPDSAP